MNKSRIITLLLASFVLLAITPSVSSAQSSTRLTWTDVDGQAGAKRVRVGDTVVVTWQDGRKSPEDVSGKIVKIDGRLKYILLDKGSNKSQMIPFDAIRDIRDTDDEIEGDSSSDPVVDDSEKKPADDDSAKEGDAEKSDASAASTSQSDEADPDKKGMFVLRLSGQVGLDFRPEEIEEIVRQADERGPGQVIVLEINSGGGYVAEGMIIRDVILDACERHRVVAWIEKAVSCASWTALCCDEIVFKKGGYTGGITIMVGRKTAADAMVIQWIAELQDLLRKKNRPDKWAVPFVLQDSYLSSTKDPETGSIEWFTDSEQSGDYSHSKPGENLYFDDKTGVEWNLAVGVAQDEEELAELLKIGDWELAGTGRKLSKDLIAARERITKEAMDLNYQLENTGGGLSGINKQIKIYKRLLQIMRQYPNIAASVLGLMGQNAKRIVEERIEELEWQKREMR